MKIPDRGPITIYSDTSRYVNIPGSGPIAGITTSGPSGPAFLREDSGYILREDGSYLLREA